MSRWLVLVLGFAAAMVGASVMCGLLLSAWVITQMPLHDVDDLPLHFARTFLLSAGIGLPFVSIGGLLIGLPVHAGLARKNIRDIRYYAVVGPLMGGISGAAIAVLLGWPEGLIFGLILGSAGGCAASLIWWWIVVRAAPGAGRTVDI